jgi:UDP-glucose 4-epimerase
MKIFVTGGSSCFARVLLPLLCAHVGVEGVTAADTRSPRFSDPKLKAIRLDIRASASPAVLHGHDALGHLAGTTFPGRISASDMFDLNVRGAQKLFHAALATTITRFVHVSSAAVYGSAVHAKEQARLNPLRGFLYAQHQAYLEHLLAIEVPECVRLRPHVILGPHVHPMIKRFLNQPFCLRLNEPQPLFQCIDGDDLAQAVILSLESDARGAYNLAAEESFTLREALSGRAWLTAGLPSYGIPHGRSRSALGRGPGHRPGDVASTADQLPSRDRRTRLALSLHGQSRSRENLTALAP